MLILKQYYIRNNLSINTAVVIKNWNISLIILFDFYFSLKSLKNEINNTTDDIPEPKNGHKALEEELWFHGVLPRGEVVRLLVTDGDFLVRETVRNDEKQIVLSVMWTSPRHFIGTVSSHVIP